MKKVLFISLLTLSLLLIGCSSSMNAPDSDVALTETTTAKYQAYSVYVFDVQYNFDAPAVVTNSPKIESRTILKETKAKDENIDLLTFKVDAQYVNSKSTIGKRATLSRYYVTRYGSVMLDSETNRVVELSFKVSDKIDTDKTVPKITPEDSYTIALEYLSHFGFTPDLGKYKLQRFGLRTIGEGTDYCHNFYSYLFTKYVDGVETTDTCSIGITEYGSLLYYTRGDEIDDVKANSLLIDYEKVDSVAHNYAKQICNSITSDNISYALSNPQILKLDAETYAFAYAIDITYSLESETLSTGLSVVIPVP